MARVLLVDDDLDQLELRKLILEQAGHEVRSAAGAADGLRQFDERQPEFVLMDLRLPKTEDGALLLRALRARSATVKILVLTGAAGELARLPDARLADHILEKPIRTQQLLALLGMVCLCLLVFAAPAAAQVFRLDQPAEAVATLTLSSPGAAGAVAELHLDGRFVAHVILFAGVEPHGYRVFLGRLDAGEHVLRASGAGVRIHEVKLEPAADQIVTTHAPVLFARPNTVGRFTDVPLLVYCERSEPAGQTLLEYTVIFSNEDGGTSTRALMARWGRTTDIEYVYRVWLAPDGSPARATIQARDHKEVEFHGRREGGHPLLMPVTDNNMVAAEGESAIRYQIAPVTVSLHSGSREQVMDQHPWTWRIMSEELAREGRLRPFGTVDGHNISDPRNYLYLEARIANQASRLAAMVRLKDDTTWRAAHLGRPDYAIERDGWIRTAIELPPGTTSAQVAEIGFECLVEPPGKDKPAPLAGVCKVEEVSRAFFLDAGYRPGAGFWSLPADASRAIPTGQVRTFRLDISSPRGL